MNSIMNSIMKFIYLLLFLGAVTLVVAGGDEQKEPGRSWKDLLHLNFDFHGRAPCDLAGKSCDGVDPKDDKIVDLESERSRSKGSYLTTDQGIKVGHTDDSLKAGERGPTLLEDFHFREKMTRFDHERIPERVVHARGTGVHGYFELTESLKDLTKAGFLTDTSRKTPVFVRFSTVQGSKGSADTVRDVRGFATKFYTEEGNFDLVGNNIPVFFVQDGIKFPDFVHAVKPEPHNEIPQGGSAHDTFWDFVGLVPESAHMVMWAMSDRGIPRSYAMMEGFGVHTYRLVNAKGKSHFVKFHWKPVLGVNSLVWDEAQKIAGKDPDFHRRDLTENIGKGIYAEFEFGVQVLAEKDADHFMKKHEIDILDVTKVWPEEDIPVRKVGKMTLNRNVDNFFAETEQVAFCVSNVVPGIDFSDDPMMQARLFSYLDTQLTRLGGPNFAEIPINRPLANVHNHQQDGFSRHRINTQVANYFPNSISGGDPVIDEKDGFTHYPEELKGVKTRKRPESFKDFYSQAALFYQSQTEPEQLHILEAFCFELGKVTRPYIQERYVHEVLPQVDYTLAVAVAKCLGLSAPSKSKSKTHKLKTCPSLSILAGQQRHDSIKGMKIAILLAPGFDHTSTASVVAALKLEGAAVEVVSVTGGTVGDGKTSTWANKTFLTTASVLYDGYYVPGGEASINELKDSGEAVPFLREAFRHAKPIGATGEGAPFVGVALFADIGTRGHGKEPTTKLPGVVLSENGSVVTFIKEFIDALKKKRFFERATLLPHRQ